jgi:hypothetical protein
MKSLIVLSLSLLLIGPARAGEESPRREIAEIAVRGGIPNLLRKARAADGREIRVAYLGGSITAASGWRVKSLEGFQERFPRVKWKEIHAAIGGTGSELGVFRVGQDALVHKPDLLFVEFAVNNGEEKIVPRFDGYCVSHRPNKFLAAANLPKDAVHTITVTLDQAGPDKRAMLFERNRPEFDKNPGKFDPKVWNVGAVMLIGEVVK